MGATSVFILALVALSAAAVYPDSHQMMAGKDTLVKQHNILELLMRVQQPTYIHNILEIANNYKLEANLNLYKNQTLVKEFLQLYKQQILIDMKEMLNVMKPEHIDQAQLVFELLYVAQDYETFYKTACWLRNRINPALFTYSLVVAVAQRPDTQDIILPAPYEILPQLFIRADVIQRALQAKMRGVQSYEDICDIVSDRNCVLIVNNTHSGQGNYWYPDETVSYWTEDIGLNAFYSLWHLEHPFWMNAKTHQMNIEHRGELFLYMHRQILARYVLERIGNGLGEVKPLQYWQQVIPEAYFPNLRLLNGKVVPSRPTSISLVDTKEISISEVYNYERRILDAIDSGIVFSQEGTKYELVSPKGVNILGEIIMGVSDSVNLQYYGALLNHLRLLVGGVVDPTNVHNVSPSVLHMYSTVLRDPIYYRLLQRINDLWQRYVERLGPYTQEELIVPGIQVENVDVDKLVTFIDHTDVSLNNVVDVANVEDANNVNIVARVLRLNHQPFTYRIALNSQKAANVMVRIFLGPKYDQHGIEIPLTERSKYYVEMDRFPSQVQVGKTMIERNSRQSTVTVPDLPTVNQLLNRVTDALQGKTQMNIEQAQRSCGLPDRLVLPRGKKQGQVYSLYVYVNEIQENNISDLELEMQSLPLCGAAYNGVYVDNKPAGFPLNRPIINPLQILVPNSLMMDVVVFHKKQENMNQVYEA